MWVTVPVRALMVFISELEIISSDEEDGILIRLGQIFIRIPLSSKFHIFSGMLQEEFPL